ncbi:MAG: trypsin-like peptidase domain-containing protein [Bacillota bacterium]|nr:trypsin-like peptidase domain-containing protein [Bacillota bacterium]
MNDYRGKDSSGHNDNLGYHYGEGFSMRSVEDYRKQRKPSQPINLTRKSLALIIVLCLVVSALAGFGGAAIGNSIFGNDSSASQGSPKKIGASNSGYTLEDATGSNMTVQEITAAAKSSVVEIKTESVTSDVWMQQYVTEGAGSGVIISEDGYILTNNHVITGAGKITVTTSDGREHEAKLIGADSMTDVAVLKVDANNLTPATYGNSDQLAVGDLAVAIGNPLGELGGTVTAGIISALDRELVIDGQTMNLLQTDSSINPGNSGGGLFNGDGQLIGIVVAKSSGSDVEGLGFAIPINTAADVAQQLMDKGFVSGQPSTGMTYTEESSGGDSFDMFFGGGGGYSGLYIYSVDGKNAKKAGFKSGDQVYAVDDVVISTFEELSSIITAHDVGDKITYTIVRNGRTMDISFRLEEKTAN